MTPENPEQARALLRDLGAPARLLHHVVLVGEAAEVLLAKLQRLGVPIADLHHLCAFGPTRCFA